MGEGKGKEKKGKGKGKEVHGGKEEGALEKFEVKPRHSGPLFHVIHELYFSIF